MKYYFPLLLLLISFQLTAQHDTLSVNAVYVDPSLFDDSELLVGWEDTYCAIAVSMDEQDTTFAPCYVVTYRDHYKTSIKLCPDNLDEVGGLGLFNGDPRLLDASLFADMEADGSDIIGDDDYTINYNNLTTGEKVGNGKYCIEAELYEGTNNTWYQTFQILKGPVNKPGMARDYHTAETIGILKNGMILEHTPPSSESTAAMMGGIIPIDYCGWHPEPAGFGHFHTIPYGINVALEANGLASDYYCVDLDQGSGSAFAGFTMEGLPIYGPKDSDGTIPTDLDDCYGHEGNTVEFPNGVYHYHASATDIINNPPCYTYYLPLEDTRFTYGEWTASAPETPGEIGGLGSVCADQTGVSYSIDAIASATSYNWTVPAGATITDGEGTISIIVDFGSTVTGEVCVNAQNSTGSSADKCLTITTASCNEAPDTPGVIDGIAEVCSDDTGIVYTIDAVATATSYNWTVPTGASLTAGAGTTSITVTFGSEVGDICVNAENSNGTSSNQCLTVASSSSCGSLPDTPETISGLDEICADQTGVEYSISAVAGATTYNWTVPIGAVVTNGQGSTDIKVTFGVVAGMVCVNAENSNGISANNCLSTALCQVTGINNDVRNARNLKVFPNPSQTGEFTIVGDYDMFSIFDINGKTVVESLKSNVGNETRIKLTKLDKGTYFIKAHKGNEVLFERILLK